MLYAVVLSFDPDQNERRLELRPPIASRSRAFSSKAF